MGLRVQAGGGRGCCAPTHIPKTHTSFEVCTLAPSGLRNQPYHLLNAATCRAPSGPLLPVAPLWPHPPRQAAVSFEAAPTCTGTPTTATSTADASGRLWGFENGKSCAFKDASGKAIASATAGAGATAGSGSGSGSGAGAGANAGASGGASTPAPAPAPAPAPSGASANAKAVANANATGARRALLAQRAAARRRAGLRHRQRA